MRQFKRSAQNTIGSGKYSFVKRSTKNSVKLFTKSELKIELIKYLGLALSEPKRVPVDCGGRSNDWYFLLEVKRLSTFRFADPEHFDHSVTAGLPDEVLDEMESFQNLSLTRVRQLHFLDLNKFPILRPALEFLMENLPYNAPLYEDMHNENFLLDTDTNTVVPYDVFNLESMEQYA